MGFNSGFKGLIDCKRKDGLKPKEGPPTTKWKAQIHWTAVTETKATTILKQSSRDRLGVDAGAKQTHMHAT